MEQRALALDPEKLVRRDRCLRARAVSAAPAMKSATTASTEIPQPAIAIPVWPVGTNSLAIPRRRASASSSSATVIFPIAQSEPTVSTTLAPWVRFSPVGTLRPGGGLRRSRSSTPCSGGERAQLGVVGDELVQAALDVEAARDAALQELAPRRREAAALRRDADERRRRAESAAPSSTVPTTGTPSWLSPARSRVEDRDDLLGPVAEHAARRLPVVRVGGVAPRRG